MKLEIVSHCWQYARLLRYQLSSLVLYPPRRLDLLMTVFFTEHDQETAALVSHFSRLPPAGNLVIRGWNLAPEKLRRREVGRNLAALTTTADWIWFADCDYFYGENALDALPDQVRSINGPLVFPREVLASDNHALGEVLVRRPFDPQEIVSVNPADFALHRYRSAIGGIQIVRGSVARRVGYCAASRNQNRPAHQWIPTKSDLGFRRSLQTMGIPIDLPDVFRIRHRRGHVSGLETLT
jgi:hypothetical protein